MSELEHYGHQMGSGGLLCGARQWPSWRGGCWLGLRSSESFPYRAEHGDEPFHGRKAGQAKQIARSDHADCPTTEGSGDDETCIRIDQGFRHIHTGWGETGTRREWVQSYSSHSRMTRGTMCWRDHSFLSEAARVHVRRAQ